MTREQLGERYAAAIQKWARTIGDMSGTVPRSLLAELSGIAEEHATEVVGEAVTERPARKTTRRA